MPPTRKLPTEKRSVQSHCKNQQLSQAIHRCNGGFHKTLYNHKRSFTKRNYSTNTSLSTHIWRQKDVKISPIITGELLKLVPARKCLLCLYEKLAILTYPSQNTLLSKKLEILFKCRHENKYLLSNFDPYT